MRLLVIFTFEVFIINKLAPDAKVKALGTYNYLYETVWKHFGLIYTQLDTSDKMGVCSLISEIFSLDVFDKGINVIIIFFINMSIRNTCR